MDKNILKIVSTTATVVGGVVAIVGSIAGNMLQKITIEEKVAKAMENLNK